MVYYTRLINGVKYLCTFNEHKFKQKSLEDNVYFTLRDIFTNAECLNVAAGANFINEELTNNISYEERDDDFEYTDYLMNKTKLTKLVTWIERVTINDFYFRSFDEYAKECEINLLDTPDTYLEEYNDYYNVSMTDYIEFDQWMDQFNELKIKLKKRLDEIS